MKVSVFAMAHQKLAFFSAEGDSVLRPQAAANFWLRRRLFFVGHIRH
jgi:hypothetical protein